MSSQKIMDGKTCVEHSLFMCNKCLVKALEVAEARIKELEEHLGLHIEMAEHKGCLGSI